MKQTQSLKKQMILIHHYLQRMARMYRLRLFKNYPPYRGKGMPLVPKFSRYEILFKSSEKNFERVITPYLQEFKWSIGRLYNASFESVDAELYYSMIRKYQPHLIIEIGSGYSTYFAGDALKKNGFGEIVCIDPEPRRNLPKKVRHVVQKVEKVDLAVFRKLAKNDILFIDSSHATEEAKYHVNKILPSLEKGVLVQHHDFFFPYALYWQNNRKTFGEPNVLLDFYWENQKCFQMVVCNSYVRDKNPELVSKLIKSFTWEPTRLPGSLWTRKIL